MPLTDKTDWSVICEPDNNTRVRQTTGDIHQRLASQGLDKLTLSLAHGSSGICLFWHQAQLCYDIPGDDLLMQYLNDLFERLDNSHLDTSLFAGLAGIGWLTDHLGLNSQLYDHNSDIDRLLLQQLKQHPWQGEYELTTGLTGIGVYGLRRHQQGLGGKLLIAVLEKLKSLALNTEQGLTWETPVNSRFCVPGSDAAQFNLSLAHGVPAVLAFYCAVIEQCPEFRSGLEPDLRAGCRWLMAQSGARGASRFGRHSECPMESRIGWGDGDLAIAVTLLRAAKVLNDNPIGCFAFDLAIQSAERPKSSYKLRDTGLRHGSAGLVLMFQLLYHDTGEPTFLQQARFWLNFTLDRAEQAHGLYAFNGLAGEYVDDPGLLEGLAGVGLALMSAATPHPPQWANLLLLI